MAKNSHDWVYTVAWANPYTSPPNGQPRVLAEDVILDWPNRTTEERRCPEWMAQLAADNPGYSVFSSPSELYRPRHQSAEAKAQGRRKRLAQRIEKKAPLFAEQFVAEELERRPDYYAGEDPYYDIELGGKADAEIEEQNRRYKERHARGR